MVENCVNFTHIGEYFPVLEVINSKFTSRAADWALLFYARDQPDAKTVEDIRTLDLTAKGLLYMKDLSIFERMKKMHTLDISGHPEFLMSEQEIQEEEEKMKEGSPQRDEIEFTKRAHTIEELLSVLKSVKKLNCDEDLETYILENRPVHNFMPSLLEINGVPLKFTDPAARDKERNIRKVLTKMWAYTGTYRIVTEDQMDEENIWYINDEVGCAIRHSDDPNFAVHPFIYAPNNTIDAHTITYSVI